MKIYDFNIHLPYSTSKAVENITGNEQMMTDDLLVEAFDYYKKDFGSLTAMNFMLFNTDLFADTAESKFIDIAKESYPESIFTALIDFRSPQVLVYLDHAKAAGVSAIKFHSYIQKISDTDFSDALRVAQYAESLGLMMFVDASYGTTRMYKYDNIKLICHLADFIEKVPIIILHSGGLRCMEAMLIVEEKKNVFLETSFTLPYYLGSRIEQDLAFIYKKIGSERILYASDAPYIPIVESIHTATKFFEENNFTVQEMENIFYHNAIKLSNYE